MHGNSKVIALTRFKRSIFNSYIPLRPQSPDLYSVARWFERRLLNLKKPEKKEKNTGNMWEGGSARNEEK